MSLKFLPIVTLSVWSAGALLFSSVAGSEVKLINATIQNLQNKVELQPQGERWRGASKGNSMQPLDALRTFGKSWAELRFNDRSLARIGEQAQFQFLPNTRTFDLRNGTVLLLIPPKQGRTRVQTPNAVAGIRGSALFIRYNPDTETTLVGALTNSEIQVAQNKEGTQAVTLQAGQMAVLIRDQIFQIYNFDLNSFYQTSEMVRDLDLPRHNPAPNPDEAIAAVQAETAEALKAQSPMTSSGVIINPYWISMGIPQTPDPINAKFTFQTGIDINRVEGLTPLQFNTAAELATRKPEPPIGTGIIATPSPGPANVEPPQPVGAAPQPPEPVRPQPNPISQPPVQQPSPCQAGGSCAVGNPTPVSPTPTPTQPTNPVRPTPAPAPQTPTVPAPNQVEPITINPAPVVNPATPAPIQAAPPVSTPTPAQTPTPAPVSVTPVQPPPVTLPDPSRPTPAVTTPSVTVTTPGASVNVTPTTATTAPVTVTPSTATVTTPSVPTVVPATTVSPAITPTPVTNTVTQITPVVTPGTEISPVITTQPVTNLIDGRSNPSTSNGVRSSAPAVIQSQP